MEHQQVELSILCFSAASLGFLHTLVGLDHAIPLVAFGKEGKWSLGKTMRVTALCGFGHVSGSVLIGLLVVWSGLDLAKAIELELGRGNWAAWMLIATGVAYILYATRRKAKDRHHSHEHVHADGIVHSHPHRHDGSHAHTHAIPARWPVAALFVAFTLGPCEVLVPVLIVPAGTLGLGSALIVASVFGLVTIATMVAMVAVLYRGSKVFKTQWIETQSHWLTGSAVTLSGLGILLAGG